MVHIPLFTKGKLVATTILEDDDVEQQGYLWHLDAAGYAARQIDGRWTRLHRVLMGLAPGDGNEVDHKNGDPLDNRRENLVVTTHAGNCQNTHTKRSLPRGVYATSWGRYYAQVKHRDQKHCLGHFDTPEAAAEAAEATRRELGFHGH